MTIYLVRHGKAGVRSRWQGDDDLRPLSKVGRRQADAIAAALAHAGITRVVSSPYVRCRQTVAPLGELLRLPVDLSDALGEHATLAESLRLLEKVLDEDAVLCTHGDVLGNLLDHLATTGVPFDDDRLEKAATWVLDVADGAVVGARYVPPPAG